MLADVGPEFGIDQVADRAGVTKPVIYRHFADRAALVEAMGERATAMLLDERMVPAVGVEDPPRLRVRGIVDAFLSFLEDNPNVYWLFVHHAPLAKGDAAQTDTEMLAALVSVVLGDFLRASGGDAGIAEVWAHGLVGFVQNAAEWWLDHRTMSREGLTDHVTALIWAQIDGVARQSGVVIDPDEPLTTDELARQRRSDDEPTGGVAG